MSINVNTTRASAIAPAERPGINLLPYLQIIREVLCVLIPALIIAVFLLTFVIQPTRVQGVSMAPTLDTGQRLVLEKISTAMGGTTQGDIVVLERPTSTLPLIKRVIATAGETIRIENGIVYVNHEPLREPYLEENTIGDMPERTIPSGYLFVMGDNRDHSNDSRAFGIVPASEIVGRAIFSYWPLNTIGLLQ